MRIELNHTIVRAKDHWAAAGDVASILGLPAPTAYGPFAVLELSNSISLDFLPTDGAIASQHYAFLIAEDDFDAVMERLREAGREWWADPFRRRPGSINHADGGRGLYWEGPDGHWLEVITRPYGAGAG